MSPNVRRRRKNESGKNSTSSSIIHRKEAIPTVIDVQDDLYSVAALADGVRVVSGDREGKIRCWRIEDAKEVGMPMDAGSPVFNIAVSRDGKLIVGGTWNGRVTVWNAETHSKVTEFKAHRDCVRAVDISPDATKIATGSHDYTACVWSLSTGKQLVGPRKHNNWVMATKFSPDGRLIATATFNDSVRVYDSQNGSLLVKFPVKVYSTFNQSLAWASDSKQLFALSHDGYIHHVDALAKTTLSKWHIHSSDKPTSIALASNGTFIVASAHSSVSFWDTTTRERIGTVIGYTHSIESMTMSSNYDLVTSGEKRITLRALYGILLPHYFDSAIESQTALLVIADPLLQEIQHAEVAKVEDKPDGRVANLEKTIHDLHIQLAESQKQAHQERDSLTLSLRIQEESSNSKIASLEKSVQSLRDKLAESQRAANQEEDRLNESINSLRTRDESSSSRITHLEHANQELHVQLADAQRKADGLNHAIEQKHQCESLFTQGRIQCAAECLLEFANTVNGGVGTNKLIVDWLTEFTCRCITALERVGDEASDAGKHDEGVAAYSAALSLGPTVPNAIMNKWTNMTLKRGSVDEALSAVTKFKVPRFVIYRDICNTLERDGRLTEAVECFQRMENELPEDAGVRDEQAEWELDFKAHCLKALEQNGDVAMDSASYEEAVAHYSTALSLNHSSADLLTKRSRARAGNGSWEDSLQDADAVITLDPSSLSGHERRHAALLGAHRYDEAINAHNHMLLMLEQSADLVTRGKFFTIAHGGVFHRQSKMARWTGW